MTTEPKSKLNNTRYLILLIQFFKIITSHAKVQIWPRCYTNWNKKKKQQQQQLRQPSWSNILPRFLHRKKFDFV